MLAHRGEGDFVFGLAGIPALLRQAAPVMAEARAQLQRQTTVTAASAEPPHASSRVSEDFPSTAAWEQPWRVIVIAEVIAAKDNPRFVVLS